MVSRPKPGQSVQLWYRESLRAAAVYHGRIGYVETVGAGRPRNHGVRVGGRLVVVPAGNLRPIKPGPVIRWGA